MIFIVIAAIHALCCFGTETISSYNHFLHGSGLFVVDRILPFETSFIVMIHLSSNNFIFSHSGSDPGV